MLTDEHLALFHGFSFWAVLVQKEKRGVFCMLPFFSILVLKSLVRAGFPIVLSLQKH